MEQLRNAFLLGWQAGASHESHILGERIRHAINTARPEVRELMGTCAEALGLGPFLTYPVARAATDAEAEIAWRKLIGR